MPTHIPVTGGGDEDTFEIKRTKWGKGTISLSITIPKTLSQTINGIAVRDKKTRSLVISELIEKGLSASQKGK